MDFKPGAIATIAYLLTFSAASAASLTIDVSNIQSSKGLVVADLHDGAKGFPKTRKPAAIQSAKAKNGTVTIVFPDIPAGTYAVGVHHDENGNRKLDTNFLGIPAEGIGTSNNPKSSFGPPSFKDASFKVGNTDQKIEVSVKY